MTLATIMSYPGGGTLFASDSRSTEFLENGQYEYSDNEQKIFPIEDSSIVLILSGSNRFCPKQTTIRSLVFSCRGVRGLDNAANIAFDFLQTHSFSNSRTRIVPVDVTNPKRICTVLYDPDLTPHCKHESFKSDKYYLVGTEWAISTAKRCSVGEEISPAEINRVRKMYHHLYELSNMMSGADNVIAPPTRIWVGHLNGTIEEV